MVCGKVLQGDYDIFRDLFAFDIDEEEIQSLNNKKLYSQKKTMFVLSIDEFLDYVMFEIESIFRSNHSKEEYSEYQRKKGYGFEGLVYSFLKEEFSTIEHTLFYYPSKDKIVETDIIIQEDNKLIIIECKSGTIDFRNALTDDEIETKVGNKVKKAYKSLDVVTNYVMNGYCFSNDRIEIKGKGEDTETLCLHLSMYPLDFISSNIHVLNDKYFSESKNPKITMSFEHLLSIIIDLHSSNGTLVDYLVRREENIIEYPKVSFDVNELDLYYEIMDKGGKSILSEFKDKNLFANFSKDLNIVTTFHDENNHEFRPAVNMIKMLDGVLIDIILMNGKTVFGLNKRYIKYLKEYLMKKV